MLLRTHLCIALFVYSISFSFFDNIWLFGIFLLFSTIFVDIDSTNSFFGKAFLFRPIQFFISHRGAVHSLLFCFLFSSLIFLLDYSAGFGFFIGYLLHLILDCFTLSGVSFFWPISKKKISGFIKTGGIFEEVLFVSFLFLDFYSFIGLVFNILS